MKTRSLIFQIIMVTSALFQLNVFAQPITIEQKLIVVKNDMTANGQFSVGVQVKGTNLGTHNTLASATIDVAYDKTKLTYNNASNWAFSFMDGYSNPATSNDGFVRIGITSMNVNINGDGTPPGFDLSDSYRTWVQLNFTIKDASGTAEVSIMPGSNAVGVFVNHANNPKGDIINGIMSATVNITGEALPVELKEFEAKQQGNEIRLSWETATEVNNYGFEVQRGGQEGIQFETVGFVKGNGNSNSVKNYTFSDKSVKSAGNYVYRLKQIDVDGKFEFSDVAEVNFSSGVNDFRLNQNRPNPFNPATVISYSLPKDSHVKLTVFNTLGREVSELVNAVQAAGNNQVTFNASSLSSGIYFYELKAEALDGSRDFREIKKLILMR